MAVSRRRFLLGTTLILASSSPTLALNYNVTNLGSLDGSGAARGLSINASGQVAGESGPHAFGTVGITGTMQPATDNKGDLGGGSSSGKAINDSGQVAGTATVDNTGNQHGFRTAANAAMTPGNDIGSLGGPVTFALGINNSGQVVGYSRLSNSNFDQHAYRTAPNAAIRALTDDLGTLGGSSSMAFAVNDSGQVVGMSTPISGPAHAFRTTAGGVISPGADLGVLAAGFSSLAQGINANGDAVGQANVADHITHAFYVPAGRNLLASDDLGTLAGGLISGAFGVNSSKVIVGASWVSSSGNDGTHAVVWYGPGTPAVDLNTLLPANSGWVLVQAQAINDAGQITGWGYYNGNTTQYAGFRLTVAVPEPASLGMLGCGAGLLLVRRRRN